MKHLFLHSALALVVLFAAACSTATSPIVGHPAGSQDQNKVASLVGGGRAGRNGGKAGQDLSPVMLTGGSAGMGAAGMGDPGAAGGGAAGAGAGADAGATGGGAAGAAGGGAAGVGGSDASVPEPRFVDNGDGNVSDTTTGLTWQKINSQAPSTQSQAAADCATAPGWRLPTLSELSGIVDLNFNPALDPAFFALTPASICNSTGLRCVFWTATNAAPWAPSGMCPAGEFTTVDMHRQTTTGVNNGQPYTQISCYSSNSALFSRCVR